MKLFFLNMILILFIILLETQSKLIGVIEIFRHGSRAPPDFTKFGKKKYFFDISSMGLTFNGFEQHLRLGTWLRQRYIYKHKLLSKKINPSELSLFSTATQRTIFSLTGHMLGLYPGVKLSPIYKEINEMNFNQEPPINVQDKRTEIKFEIKNRNEPTLHSWNCKLKNRKLKYHGLRKHLFKFSRSRLRKMVKVFKNKIPHLFSKKHKIGLHNLLNRLVGYIRCVNFLTGRNTFNLSKGFIHKIKTYVINKWYGYRLNKKNEPFIRIAVSKLFNDIRNYFKNMSRGVETKKLILFSGHDTNLIDIISNLIDHDYLKQLAYLYFNKRDDKAYNFLVPTFASNIIFELHQIDEKHYVKILYNGEELVNNFISKNLRFIANKGIDLGNFLLFLEKRINANYKKLEC